MSTDFASFTRDPAIILGLVRRRNPRILDILASMHYEPDDVAQECWVAVLHQEHRYDITRGSLASWIGTVALHCCYNLLRKVSRRPLGTSIPEDYPAPEQPEATPVVQWS